MGKLYHEYEIVYGPGLVKAYELESKIAVYPRIVMISSDFDRSIMSCSKISQSSLREEFIPDKDGFLTLDCFYYINQKTLELCRFNLEQMKASDLIIQQKINWTMDTVNLKFK